MSIQLADWSIKYPIGVCENLLVKVSKFIFPVNFVILEMDEDELVSIILGRPFLTTARAVIDIHEGKLSLRVENETFTFNIGKSIKSKHSRDDYLYCADHTVKLIQEQWFDTVNHDGKWTEEDEEEDFNKSLAVSFYPRTEPVEPLEWKAPNNRLKPSSVEPPKLELKELPKHLEYAFLQEDNQLPVIIADIKGIDSSFCTHKILMEDKFKPSVQPQRQVNPNIKEVVKKKVIKLLDTRLIYPISDSPWVNPVQVAPKKGGMTVVKNEKDKLIPQWTITGWCVCIDYRKLNNMIRKDHFPLPFIDQMLERLAGHEYYCFLDGFSGYFQIPIAPEDQEKTTFICPYRTFAYKRIPFGLCNALTTFQRCMTAIFHELIEDSMEVFMDDFSVFGSSFDHCLKNLEKMLKRYEETNLVLNWEKCHFMVKERIILGHKVSGSRIEIHDKKGVENLAADHLSRLENPNLRKLTRADIRDLFPEERLMAIFDKNNEPWYFAFGRHLEELHVTWTHLEKKQTRLQTYTNIDQEFLYSGWRRRNFFDDEASSSNNTGPKPPNPPKTLHEHSRPTSSGFQNPITVPTEQTGRIVDSRDIWLIQNTCTFQGLKNEDPLRHVKNYLSIVDNIQADGATRDTSRNLDQFTQFRFHSLTEEEGWIRIEEYVQYQDDLWDDMSPPMNISSISETMQPIFRGRLKRACNQISYLETPSRDFGLKTPYLICDYCGRYHEADECKQLNPAEQVCLFGGDFYDDPSFLRFYQNDDTSPWGNSKRKEKGEDSPEWIVRSKFEDELANFMLEKKSHIKGIGDMLV
ncbi:putative nucleotidyltransferase, ribonuclease H [Tanacetum coccineum]